LGDQVEPLVVRDRAQRGPHGGHDVRGRVVAQRQLQATGLDLREVEHVVDETQQMLAVGLDVGQRLLQLGRHLAVQIVEDQLREAEDGVQRGAQLVRSEEHTSELQSRFDLVCRLLLEKKKGETSTVSATRQ